MCRNPLIFPSCQQIALGMHNFVQLLQHSELSWCADVIGVCNT